MRSKILLIILFFITFCKAQTINFLDANFKAKLLSASSSNQIAKDLSSNYFKIDSNNDGEIQITEALQTSYLNISNSNISDLSGLENFTSLNYLFVNNNLLTNLTLNSSILSIDASYNNIQDLTILFNSTISSINISNNLLTNLSVYSCSNLNTLTYANNPLLNSLNISNTNLINLNISNFPNLNSINCDYNSSSGGTKLNSIITSNLPMVNMISCVNNNLTNLDLSGVPNLSNLNCKINNLTSLNLNGLSSLFWLDCSNNQITILNTASLLSISIINCSSNQLLSLNLSNLNNLQNVNCSNNLMTSLLVNNSMLLQNLNCSNNQILNINASGLSNLQEFDCSYNLINSINTTGLINLQTFKCNNNQLATINVSGLTNLSQLYCLNNQLQTLNLDNLPNLYDLDFSNNLITTVNVSTNLSLQTLYCSNNQITAIDLTGLNNLIYFKCNYNNLTTFNVSNLPNLGIIQLAHNQLTSLSISNLQTINALDCSYNLLPSLTLFNLPNTFTINCNNNLITTLDLNGLSGLYGLSCNNNLLTSLFIKVNEFTYGGGDLDFSGNPNLQYICADEVKFTMIQNKINQYGYANCTVGSYCTFYPSGTYYLIQGTSRYDGNLNGCDSNDLLIPNMKFSVTNGSTIGNFIAGTSGTYSFPVLAGSNVVVPKFDNPSYYNSSPASVTVSFPSNSSPFLQNFCITKNGNHNDLEITILPLSRAIPGFDVIYKIIYKNKGVTTQTGSINLSFNDNVLDFIIANPTISSQVTNTLTWTYINLLPFESREILVTLNLNSPMETPAVNSGDILNYTAVISGLTDEDPIDNIANLNQTVVNSFDPNDKTCLQGTTITPSMIGKFVHYMIRFENNGTANAQNIVVKDIIDSSKFDINSLITISGSHTFETRISNTNKVEFIFQNINLPFDDANNDGYVSFKIKTKPNLVIGDTFSNSANIYFDYNFPIVTNNYTTTVQNTLGFQENYFINDIVAYPNPVKDFLSFKTENKIFKIEVYDIAGRILSSNLISENKIDLSVLKTGNYILKLYTEKGIMNTKIMKE
ncbi:MAG: T9SS type A sorting domain-containing protein [Flavobacterium sp.]|nr:T9SS type A sorting domain-containing protein [Flavobacterium sp.]